MKRPANFGKMWLRQCVMINQTIDAIPAPLAKAADPANADRVFDTWQLVRNQVHQVLRGRR